MTNGSKEWGQNLQELMHTWENPLILNMHTGHSETASSRPMDGNTESATGVWVRIEKYAFESSVEPNIKIDIVSFEQAICLNYSKFKYPSSLLNNCSCYYLFWGKKSV